MKLCICCRLHPVVYQCPIDAKLAVCPACACKLSGEYGWTWTPCGGANEEQISPKKPITAIGALSDSVTTVGQNIQTVAIVGLCVGALLFMYFIHEGHKTANRAFDFASAHPETVAKLAAVS